MRTLVCALALVAGTSALAAPGGPDDPLLYPPWERPSATLPWTAGFSVNVFGGLQFDLQNGLELSPYGPQLEADAWLDVFQVGISVDREVDRVLVRVLNRMGAARDVQFTAIGIEAGRHWGFTRVGVHYRHVLSKRGKMVTGSTSRLLFGGEGLPLALESWYDFGYRFTTKNVAITPAVYGWLGVGNHKDFASDFSTFAGVGVSLKIAVNTDLDL